MTLPQFEAQATATPAEHWQVGKNRLLEAALDALTLRRPELLERRAHLGFTTTIPRQAGLAGSSAIIMAALRALADLADFTWDPVELAQVTLAVETDTLGWTAGPQDRVVQAYEQLLDMSFATPWNASDYHPLDPAKLPPLFLAWNQSQGTPSGVVHAGVKERWDAGDVQISQIMADFAALAERGRETMESGEATDIWPLLLDRAFELRTRIYTISETDLSLVQIGTRRGAGVSLAGSGGAVVGAYRARHELPAIEAGYRGAGYGFMLLTP